MSLSSLLLIQGLFWDFYGTAILFFEIIFDLLGLNEEVILKKYYPNKTKYSRMEKKESGEGYYDVSLTKKEKRLIIGAIFIILGLISQLIGYLM